MKLTKSAIVIVMTVALAACTTFQSRPVSPTKTAKDFEARTLENRDLREFLQANLVQKITPWPPKMWSFSMLTLVAFYYHPDLDLARAKWGVAQAGVITAGGIPNPMLGLSPGFNSTTTKGISPWIPGLNLDIPIETAGKRGYRIDKAQRVSAAARLNIAGIAWHVRSRLRVRLLDLYAAEQRKALLEKQQRDHEENVMLLEQRLAAGEASQPDVTLARISLHQTSLALQEAQRQSAEARVRVADALGLGVRALDGVAFSFEGGSVPSNRLWAYRSKTANRAQSSHPADSGAPLRPF